MDTSYTFRTVVFSSWGPFAEFVLMNIFLCSFQQAEEDCSKAISLDKKVKGVSYLSFSSVRIVYLCGHMMSLLFMECSIEGWLFWSILCQRSGLIFIVTKCLLSNLMTHYPRGFLVFLPNLCSQESRSNPNEHGRIVHVVSLFYSEFYLLILSDPSPKWSPPNCVLPSAVCEGLSETGNSKGVDAFLQRGSSRLAIISSFSLFHDSSMHIFWFHLTQSCCYSLKGLLAFYWI